MEISTFLAKATYLFFPNIIGICGLSASLLFANDDRDVYDVWLSHWLRVSNVPIGVPHVINVSIFVREK